jgi:hypothetical protein
MLKLARDKKLLGEPTAVGVDGTRLEANAAMKGIVRRDTGEDYQESLRKLATAAGIKDPSAEDLRRFDRARTDKTCSNQDWESPTDPDAEIARRKDGTTHLAYKAEHVVDLDSALLLAARILPATAHDTVTIEDSVVVAQGHLDAAATLRPEPRTEAEHEAAIGAGPRIKEVVADKGYCKGQTLADLDAAGVRTYIAVPQRRGRNAKHNANGKDKDNGNGNGKDHTTPAGRGRKRTKDARSPEVRRAERLNAQRQARAKGKAHHRRRSEVVERSFAHVCETGGARRTWLAGFDNLQKRYHVVAAARNLGLLMLKLFGVGKPRGLQGLGAALAALRAALQRLSRRYQTLRNAIRFHRRAFAPPRPLRRASLAPPTVQPAFA